MKSMNNLLLLGDGETWARQRVDFAGLPEMVRTSSRFLEADYIVANIADEQAPVRLLHVERDLAPTIQMFVAKLDAGAFDWLI